jgi:hypothetical protein
MLSWVVRHTPRSCGMGHLWWCGLCTALRVYGVIPPQLVPSLNIIRWSLMVTKHSTRSQLVDQTCPSIALDAELLRVCSFPERVHCAKIPTGRIRSQATWCAPACGQRPVPQHLCEDNITVRHRPSDVGPACQIHSVRASVKMTKHIGQRPGSARCEALALDLEHAAVNYWPNANVSIQSLCDQRPVSVS